MKSLVNALIAFLCALAHCYGQGTLYVSNLEQSPSGTMAIGSDSWVAQEFFTGTNAGGYVLNSIQLLMEASSGNPGGFTVSVCAVNSISGPGNNLGDLTGPDPSAGGIFTYSSSGITLLPGLYVVLLTGNTQVGQGAYEWSAKPGGGTQGDDGWFIGHLYWSSMDGANWNSFRDKYFQMAIYATPIPEPSAICLIFGAAGLLAWCRRRAGPHSKKRRWP